jgi:DNA-binding NtrC family response regulator
MGGIEILKDIQAKNLDITFIVITANGSVSAAVDAMRLGAYDFLIKPFSNERLVTSVSNAIEREKLKKKVDTLARDTTESLSGFIGNSVSMQNVYKTISNVSNSKAPVFITGESGTGKEVTARALHDLSDRKEQPFVAINCAAIPDNLMESEIFGHIKGAFTGAENARKGAASMADGGTLFLDEICEMDIGLQSKLLRFIQTGKIKRVGSDWLEDVDARIVCATNRDPMQEVAEKRFREDLLYRLNVLSIELPPLRERGSDILTLAEHFLHEYTKEERKTFNSISQAAQTDLLAYRWPGNIRELQNTIRKAVVMFDGPELDANMLQMQAMKSGAEYALIQAVEDRAQDFPERPQLDVTLDRPFVDIEREIIEAVIDLCNGSIPKAARMLELSPSTIYRKREGWTPIDKDMHPTQALG